MTSWKDDKVLWCEISFLTGHVSNASSNTANASSIVQPTPFLKWQYSFLGNRSRFHQGKFVPILLCGFETMSCKRVWFRVTGLCCRSFFYETIFKTNNVKAAVRLSDNVNKNFSLTYLLKFFSFELEVDCGGQTGLLNLSSLHKL